MKNESTNFYYENLWSYFEMHAKQRMYTFYLYIFADGFLFKTLMNVSELSDQWLLVGIIWIFTLAFYCLDKRNLFMINSARNVIRAFENDHLAKDYRLFNMVYDNTGIDEKKYCCINIFKYPYKFSTCFYLIFLSSAILAPFIIIL